MNQSFDRTRVFCLHCKKDVFTKYQRETSCVQCICFACFLPCPPLCILPYCCNKCYERFHYCEDCGELIFKSIPADFKETQWVDEFEEIEAENDEDDVDELEDN